MVVITEWTKLGEREGCGKGGGVVIYKLNGPDEEAYEVSLHCVLH